MHPRGWPDPRATLALAIAAALLVACSPSAAPAGPPAQSAPGPARPAGSAPAPPATQPAAADPFTAAKTMSLDELHQKALEEGGTLSLYSSLAQANAERILPVFEQRFRGITVDHAGGPADRLVARVVAEARGGRVLADAFSSNVEYLAQLHRQGLVVEEVPPEAAAYPEELRGTYWVANDVVYIVTAWHTGMVPASEAPRRFEDLADPKWRNKLIGDPRDFEVLVGLALRKYGSEDQAIQVLRRIAANDVEFHNGHVELAELLVAGHAPVCFTCYAHHFPARMRRGAPVDYSRAEGIGLLNGSVVFKNAPHPYTGMLWTRWVHSPEGQQAYADGGRTPVLPGVQVRDDVRPEVVYALGPDQMANIERHQRTWRDIFQVR